MVDTRFTAVGLSGSGKTCYLLGMYYEMCVGINGFTLVTTNRAATKLEDWMDQLDDETGMDRFPVGTSLTEFSNYSFKLNYYNEPVMSFDWADYGGGTIHARNDNPEVYTELINSINESTALYIFIDGELLCNENPEKRMRNIERKCKAKLNSIISNFVQSHAEELPPIVFVITKSDLCRQYVTQDEIKSILIKNFKELFAPGRTNYIVAVSLGEEIADDDYSGEVEPVNIHIPFFIGIFHEFLNFCLYIKRELLKDEQKHQNKISESQNAIDYEYDRWFTNYDRINRCKKQIEESKERIKNNREELQKYRKLLIAVATELAKVNSKFKFFYGEEEKDFSPADLISEI